MSASTLSVSAPARSAVHAGLHGDSLPQLKPLETVELLLDPALQRLARVAFRGLALADPAPFLHQELLVLPIGLEIQRGDDVAADHDRQREIAELALFLWHVSLEAVFVVEERVRPLALDDQRIEGREDVHERSPLAPIILIISQLSRPRPRRALGRAFKRARPQSLAPHPPL